MLLTCTHKGCLKLGEHKLKVQTDEVICEYCGNAIENITEYTKRVMKSSGQIIKEVKKAFMMACKNCNANREIMLDVNNNPICKLCGSPVIVHAAMRQAMIEIAKINQEELEDPEAATDQKTNKQEIKKQNTKKQK